MTRLGALTLAASFAAATLAPGMAVACMKNSVTAQQLSGGSPAIVADGAATVTTTPMTPLPTGKTGG